MNIRPVALGLVLAMPAPAQKTPDIDVSNTPALVAEPRLLVTGDTVCAAWEAVTRAPSADIEFARSTDRGHTWSSPIQLNVDASARSGADLHLCGDGAWVYAAWIQPARTEIRFNRSADGGATWLPGEIRIDREPSFPNQPTSPHLASAGDHVYVVYESMRNGQPDIYFNRSTDGGLTWQANDVRLDTDAPGARTSRWPRLSVAGSTVYAVWYDDRELLARFRPRVNVSTDGGMTWLAADRGLPSVNPTLPLRPFQIASSGDRVHVAFESLFEICVASSDDAGASWATTCIGSGSHAALAMDGSDVYACWADKDIYFARSLDGGASWGSPLRVDRSPLNWWPASDPRIAVAGGIVGVCWLDSRPEFFSSPDIYFTRSTNRGATWPPFDTRVSTVPKASPREPLLAAAGSNFYVLWNNGDIRFNIPFGVQPYGVGTAGSGGIAPRLVDSGAAVLGSTVSLQLERGLGGAPGAWIIGNAATSAPVAGGTLLVTPQLVAPLVLGGAAAVPGDGTTSLPVKMPSVPSVIGVSIYLQGVVVDPGAPGGLSFSDARELWIG